MQPQNFKEVVNLTLALLDRALFVIIGIAFIVILWGGVQLIWSGGDERRIQSARQILLWGVVGMFVMVSVWGLVFLVKNTFFP